MFLKSNSSRVHKGYEVSKGYEGAPPLVVSSCTLFPMYTLCTNDLLYFYSGPSVGELLLDRLGLVLADAFLDRLGSAVDQVLCFLQAEAGDFAYCFDDVDLIRADHRQNYRK